SAIDTWTHAQQSSPYNLLHFNPKYGKTNFEVSDQWRGQQGVRGLGVVVLGTVVLLVVPGFFSS
ncbi:hypothetical protein A2U01_0109095, partial [Trifolium medium]|nr:hypothetical protein [Trifolium medium]